MWRNSSAFSQTPPIIYGLISLRKCHKRTSLYCTWTASWTTSASFRTFQPNRIWLVGTRKSYAIMATLQRIHHLVTTLNGFDLYTDHKNLIFLSHLLSFVTDLNQKTVFKVLRLAVCLSTYNYTCIHIKGLTTFGHISLVTGSQRSRYFIYYPYLYFHPLPIPPLGGLLHPLPPLR